MEFPAVFLYFPVNSDFSRAETAAYPRSRLICYKLHIRFDRATKEMSPSQLFFGEQCVEQSVAVS